MGMNPTWTLRRINELMHVKCSGLFLTENAQKMEAVTVSEVFQCGEWWVTIRNVHVLHLKVKYVEFRALSSSLTFSSGHLLFHGACSAQPRNLAAVSIPISAAPIVLQAAGLTALLSYNSDITQLTH